MTDLMNDMEVQPVAFRSIDWMDDAYCKPGSGIDGELFFPTRTEPISGTVITACKRCTVRSECLEYALADPHIQGVWGGTQYEQRVRIRAERARSEAVENPVENLGEA